MTQRMKRVIALLMTLVLVGCMLGMTGCHRKDKAEDAATAVAVEEEKKDAPSAKGEKDKTTGEGERGAAKHSVENYHQFDLQLENVPKPVASDSENLKTPTTRQRKGMSLTEYRKRYGAMQS